MAQDTEGVPVSLHDYEVLAERALDRNAWAYVVGGAGDEITMRWNRAAFERYGIVPRVLRRSEVPSTAFELLGQRFAHPILVGPLAYQRLVHPDGEIAAALACAAQEALMVLSTLSSTRLETVARAEGNACRWFQLYMQERREETLRLVRRAEEAGYRAIVVTVDAPLSGLRNRERRIGFRLPAGVKAANLPNASMQAPGDFGSGLSSTVFGEYLRLAPGWEDVRWLVSNCSLPVLLKGIASPRDAEIAIECGAQGIVVSNHGGRTLDTIPATLDLLPPIVKAVRGRVPILIDGGIRRGTDVFKSLALGANAVLIGRPVLFGLAVGGAMGASHVLRILKDEFEMAMVLAGAMTLGDIGAEQVIRMGGANASE